METFSIECTILTGCGTGEVVSNQRILLTPTDIPIPVNRPQFPVKLFFSTTINKARTLTLKVSEFEKTVDFFSHEQLYVLSHMTTIENLFLLSNEKKDQYCRKGSPILRLRST